MKVQVLSVQPTIAPNSHEVLLSVGADRYKFIFTTEVNRVGEHLLQTTHGDSAFSEMFRFNQRVAMKVTNLVVKCYNERVCIISCRCRHFCNSRSSFIEAKTI